MNTLQILIVVMAASCASQARNIRSRRFVNQPPPGNNHLDIQALMALFNNPGLMKGLGQINSQQQPQPQQQQPGTGQIPQAKVTRQSAPNQGQPQPEPLPSKTKPQNPPVTQHTQNQGQVQGGTPAQNAGQGNGQTQQAPVPSQSVNSQMTVDPMQQFVRYSNMFNDPMFLQYFQQFMRRINRMKPKYRKGDFIPPKGLFPGGYVISADGSDADVRDIYGKLHSIDGGVFQA